MLPDAQQVLSAVIAQVDAVVVVEVVVVVSVVQADVTELHVQEPQRVLKMPQLTLHRSVQERPEHWVAQLDWALKAMQQSPLNKAHI